MDEPLAPLPAFGRRSQRAASVQANASPLPTRSSRSFARPASAQKAQAQAALKPFVAHYSWRMALLGLSLLVMAYKLAGAGFVMSGDRPYLEVIGLILKGKGGDGAMFVMSGAFAGLIGLAWLMQGIFRGRALTIDAKGVEGFTVLGTKRFAWADVDRVEICWHAKFKRMLTIHGKVGTASVGWGVTGIPITLARINRREADILAAIRTFAPDVPIIDLGGEPGFLVLCLMKFAEQLERQFSK